VVHRGGVSGGVVDLAGPGARRRKCGDPGQAQADESGREELLHRRPPVRVTATGPARRQARTAGPGGVRRWGRAAANVGLSGAVPPPQFGEFACAGRRARVAGRVALMKAYDSATYGDSWADLYDDWVGEHW